MDPQLTRLIWNINGWLAGLVLCLAVAVFLTVLLRQSARRRKRKALKIIREQLAVLSRADAAARMPQCRTMVQNWPVHQLLTFLRNQKRLQGRDAALLIQSCLGDTAIRNRIVAVAAHGRKKWDRVKALLCLGYLPDPVSEAILRHAVRERDENLSYYAMLALAQIRTRANAQFLLATVAQRPEKGQKIAALLETFPPVIVPELLQALRHSQKEVRFWSLKLLTKFNPEDGRPEIERLTADPSPDCRAAACECLGQLRDPQSVTALKVCLSDTHWFVRMRAVRALEQISGIQDLKMHVENLLADSSIYVRLSAQDLLVRHAREPGIPWLPLLQHPDEQVRRHALGALADANEVVRLLYDFSSPDTQIRAEARTLLQAMIQTRLYFGLKRHLDPLDEATLAPILEWLTTVDAGLAQTLKKQLEKR